jgi:hypothetical protein
MQSLLENLDNLGYECQNVKEDDRKGDPKGMKISFSAIS